MAPLTSAELARVSAVVESFAKNESTSVGTSSEDQLWFYKGWKNVLLQGLFIYIFLWFLVVLVMGGFSWTLMYFDRICNELNDRYTDRRYYRGVEGYLNNIDSRQRVELRHQIRSRIHPYGLASLISYLKYHRGRYRTETADAEAGSELKRRFWSEPVNESEKAKNPSQPSLPESRKAPSKVHFVQSPPNTSKPLFTHPSAKTQPRARVDWAEMNRIAPLIPAETINGQPVEIRALRAAKEREKQLQREKDLVLYSSKLMFKPWEGHFLNATDSRRMRLAVLGETGSETSFGVEDWHRDNVTKKEAKMAGLIPEDKSIGSKMAAPSPKSGPRNEDIPHRDASRRKVAFVGSGLEINPEQKGHEDYFDKIPDPVPTKAEVEAFARKGDRKEAKKVVEYIKTGVFDVRYMKTRPNSPTNWFLKEQLKERKVKAPIASELSESNNYDPNSAELHFDATHYNLMPGHAKWIKSTELPHYKKHRNTMRTVTMSPDILNPQGGYSSQTLKEIRDSITQRRVYGQPRDTTGVNSVQKTEVVGDGAGSHCPASGGGLDRSAPFTRPSPGSEQERDPVVGFAVPQYTLTSDDPRATPRERAKIALFGHLPIDEQAKQRLLKCLPMSMAARRAMTFKYMSESASSSSNDGIGSSLTSSESPSCDSLFNDTGFGATCGPASGAFPMSATPAKGPSSDTSSLQTFHTPRSNSSRSTVSAMEAVDGWTSQAELPRERSFSAPAPSRSAQSPNLKKTKTRVGTSTIQEPPKQPPYISQQSADFLYHVDNALQRLRECEWMTERKGQNANLYLYPGNPKLVVAHNCSSRINEYKKAVTGELDVIKGKKPPPAYLWPDFTRVPQVGPADEIDQLRWPGAAFTYSTADKREIQPQRSPKKQKRPSASGDSSMNAALDAANVAATIPKKVVASELGRPSKKAIHPRPVKGPAKRKIRMARKIVTAPHPPSAKLLGKGRRAAVTITPATPPIIPRKENQAKKVAFAPNELVKRAMRKTHANMPFPEPMNPSEKALGKRRRSFATPTGSPIVSRDGPSTSSLGSSITAAVRAIDAAVFAAADAPGPSRASGAAFERDHESGNSSSIVLGTRAIDSLQRDGDEDTQRRETSATALGIRRKAIAIPFLERSESTTSSIAAAVKAIDNAYDAAHFLPDEHSIFAIGSATSSTDSVFIVGSANSSTESFATAHSNLSTASFSTANGAD